MKLFVHHLRRGRGNKQTIAERPANEKKKAEYQDLAQRSSIAPRNATSKEKRVSNMFDNGVERRGEGGLIE